MKKKNDIDRRLVRVPMYEEIVEDLFTRNADVRVDLPDDARFDYVFEDVDRRVFNFVFKSQEFDVVDAGDVIPELDVEVVQEPEDDGLSYSYE